VPGVNAYTLTYPKITSSLRHWQGITPGRPASWGAGRCGEKGGNSRAHPDGACPSTPTDRQLRTRCEWAPTPPILIVLVVAGGVTMAASDSNDVDARWQAPIVINSSAPVPTPAPSQEPASKTITLSATGDVING